MPDFYKMVLRLDAENDRLHKSLEKSTRRIQKFEKSSGNSLKSVKAHFANIGRLAGKAFAAGGLLAGLSSVVREAESSQRQLAKLNALVETTGGVAGFTGRQLDEMARNLARSTLASTEGVRDAVGALLTFRSVTGETFERAIRLSQDLATVMGGDLRSNVTQLGKALEDPTRGLTALRRAGVSFTESEKQVIRSLQDSGRLFEAQGLILEKLEQQVGGAATGEAGGLSGAIDTLGQNWSELLEAVGNTGPLDAATTAIRTLSDMLGNLRANVAPTLDELAEKLQQLETVGLRGRNRSGTAARIRSVQEEIQESLEAAGGAEGARAQLQSVEDSIRQLQQRRDSITETLEGLSPEEKTSRFTGRGRNRGETPFGRLSKELDAANKSLDDAVVNRTVLLEKLADIELAFDQDTVAPALKSSASNGGEASTSSTSGRTGQTSLALVADADAHLQLFEQLKREADALTEHVRTPWEVAADELTRYDELLEANLITQDTWARATNEAIDGASDGIEKLVEETETADSTWRDLGITFSSAFEDAVVSGAKLGDVIDGLAQDIQRILVRKLFTEKIASFFSEQSSSGGGLGGLFSSFFGGGKAAGGPVAAGIPYLIGEKGPELFVPNNAGTIVPNAKAGMTNNINIRVDGGAASSGRTSQNQLATRIGQAVDRALKRNT